MRLYVKFTGLFLYVKRARELFVFAPTTGHLPSNEQHFAHLSVAEGIGSGGLDLNVRRLTLPAQTGVGFALPTKVPSLGARGAGNPHSDLYQTQPVHHALHSRIHVPGLQQIAAGAGAKFRFSNSPALVPIANSVYCDLGDVSNTFLLEAFELRGNNALKLTVSASPAQRAVLTIEHATKLDPKMCKEHQPELQPRIEHFLSLYPLFRGGTANPDIRLAECMIEDEPPSWFPRTVRLYSADPVTCVGGGG